MNVYKGKLLKLNVNKHGYELVKHPGAVVIIPVFNQKDILLIKQYRFAVRKYLLELPAGTLKKNESFLACAKRELEEETGYKAGKIKKVLSFFSSPGFCTEKMHLFIASNLIKSIQNLDEDEKIEIVKINIKKAIEKIKKNEIIDSKTITGLLFYNNIRRKSIA